MTAITKKPHIFKATEAHGITLSNPGWFMYDGTATFSCSSWEEAIEKAFNRIKESNQ